MEFEEYYLHLNEFKNIIGMEFLLSDENTPVATAIIDQKSWKWPSQVSGRVKSIFYKKMLVVELLSQLLIFFTVNYKRRPGCFGILYHKSTNI